MRKIRSKALLVKCIIVGARGSGNGGKRLPRSPAAVFMRCKEKRHPGNWDAPPNIWTNEAYFFLGYSRGSTVCCLTDRRKADSHGSGWLRWRICYRLFQIRTLQRGFLCEREHAAAVIFKCGKRKYCCQQYLKQTTNNLYYDFLLPFLRIIES